MMEQPTLCHEGDDVGFPLVELDTLHWTGDVQPHADRGELPVGCFATVPRQGHVERVELTDRLPHGFARRADDFRHALGPASLVFLLDGGFHLREDDRLRRALIIEILAHDLAHDHQFVGGQPAVPISALGYFVVET
ncbi:hypothetical protein GALL_458700 [mine drainage metagenome]|uniref:Uncharacterized protein n=1 Tax=mine drainage metagenome TaxID=410659 RepID=A0A1J5PXH1_9ZZZZ